MPERIRLRSKVEALQPVDNPNLPDAVAGIIGEGPGSREVSAQRATMAPTARDVGDSLVGNVPDASAGQQSPLPLTARDGFVEDQKPIFSGRTPGT